MNGRGHSFWPGAGPGPPGVPLQSPSPLQQQQLLLLQQQQQQLLPYPFNPNNNVFIQNPFLFMQNPSLQIPQNPNFPIPQTPNFTIPQNPNQSAPQTSVVHSAPQQQRPPGVVPTRKQKPQELERIEKAVVKAHHDLLAAGEGVSSWAVIQSALLSLQVDSWDSLGVRMQQVPSLYRLFNIEGKVNAFINCYVAARRIATLYDLNVAICKNEGVEMFEELKLGPLWKHPLIVHYFFVPTNANGIHEITCEEVMSHLVEYIESCNGKDVQAEGLLDFIANKESVAVKEKLGVRIQSLRMYIFSIQEARKAEASKLSNYVQTLKQKSKHNREELEESRKLPPNFSQKKILDKKFNELSQRLKSFSPIHGDLSGKHIRFVSSSSESDNDENDVDSDYGNTVKNHSRSSPQTKQNCNHIVSSCPYPSASEEMARLGSITKKVEFSPASGSIRCDEGKRPSARKRKWLSLNMSSACKSQKTEKPESSKVGRDFFSRQENNRQSQTAGSGDEHSTVDVVEDFMLTNDVMERFITTWKDTCRMHSVSEVLERMLNFYNCNETGQRVEKIKAITRRIKKMKSLFLLYPCIGLLNIAVVSIKRGMWDSLYDTFQTIGQDECAPISSALSADFERIDVEHSSKRIASSIDTHASQHKSSVSVADVLEKICAYSTINHVDSKEGKTPLEKQLLIIRKLRDCEIWLTQKFSVKGFESLGFGEFLQFLEEHSSRLPDDFCGSYSGERSKTSFLEVTMLENQLVMLLSQAASSLRESDTITNRHVSLLLKNQFPLVSFQVAANDPSEELFDFIKKHEKGNISGCLLFSVSLLGTLCTEDKFLRTQHQLPETTGEDADLSERVGALGAASSKEAVECLLRAPMLSDLLSWSHWDLVFAPSLGPLIDWLSNEVPTKELLCLATKDGKIIRIDHSVTVDEFLEAALQGSSFNTALKLLSLVSLYGGVKQVPLSLLKSHARQAIEVMLKNSLDFIEDKCDWDVNLPGKVLRQQIMLPKETIVKPLAIDHFNSMSHVMVSEDLFRHQSRLNKAIPVASSFILDCLGHLPSEFRSFAADILLSGLRSITKDAPRVILRECSQINHRVMLHEIGLSLGIVEWAADYHSFNSATPKDSFMSIEASNCGLTLYPTHAPETTKNRINSSKSVVAVESDRLISGVCSKGGCEKDLNEVFEETMSGSCIKVSSEEDCENDSTSIIESIRREEFGLLPSLTHSDSIMLKKQHARLGRALHCLSQELYSQDSHFLLELVQNADDNVYPESVEPSLVFILQANGIIVLNNEQGFSASNIRALCDVGNSTKKGVSAGYIGQKGIGFKSVFRVTDAPEIHSNGFHIKFDISDGQIGFVLPTVVSPCDISYYERLVSSEVNQVDVSCWRTCIVLPFKSKLKEGAGMSSVVSMFSDLHPSLLLFLHRLRCIKFKNMIDDSCTVMRRETTADGIVKVSHGDHKMSWLVASKKLQANVIRPDVQTTEISIAFTLQESANGEYKPHLDLQPVFAFLPLRTYGLKFILQGDFVLPSSREEVDGDSAWNQWLLSEVPGLFVSAQQSFCALPCFEKCPGKAVVAYMSFVPLIGEIHGFFSHLPRMIISKLRVANCLLLEGHDKEWVPPCRALRGWDEQACALFPECLLNQHLGLGYLDKNIILSDPLAKALGIQEYGPKILVELISSISSTNDGIKSMGMDWLSSWLSVLYSMMVHFSEFASVSSGMVSDLTIRLKQIAFIPLSDGTYSSVTDGTVWLPSDSFSNVPKDDHGPDVFPSLYAKLRMVSSSFLSSAAVSKNNGEARVLDNCIRMLNRIGVQRLSAHDIIREHILPALCDNNVTKRDKDLMIEYLSYVMLHLQSSCPSCSVEREHIISELKNNAFVLTNHGYKRLVEVPVHFSLEFGNPIDVSNLNDATESKWHEVDTVYLNQSRAKSLSFGLKKWREFFQELGVTDFVQMIQVEKNVVDVPHSVLKNMIYEGDLIPPGSVLRDWECPELARFLVTLSSQENLHKCKYLLQILDKMWDDYFSAKVTGCCVSEPIEDARSFKSSFIKNIHEAKWVVSSLDQKLHYPADLFYDCEAVRSILGASVPYVVPQVKSINIASDLGFKTKVTLDDALSILQFWRRSGAPFNTSIAQMCKFYSFIWDGVVTSKAKILAELSLESFIFVPCISASQNEDFVQGMFVSTHEVSWHDPTGAVDRARELVQSSSTRDCTYQLSTTLAHVYPGLHNFFVNECGVREIPTFRGYVQILTQLSNIALPSQAASAVSRIFWKWADDLRSGLVGSEDVHYLKDFLLKTENTVLPTIEDKWVSLHSTFGLVCWCDDEELKMQFKHSDKISFLYFGELSNDEKETLPEKVANFMQSIGVPSLSEVITREAIFYGIGDYRNKASLLNWILPFAQRYFYKSDPDKYSQFKQSGLENLSRLQIVVVENLFFKYALKGCDSKSNKRFKCKCLLQENKLYLTQDSDSHSIFLEFSRLFYHGTPQLHLANFLHMITTMAETGSTEEHTEHFVVNSQKVPTLPNDEPTWCLSSLISSQEGGLTSQPTCSSTILDEQNLVKSKRKPGMNVNWPPADWKTAPGCSFSRANNLNTGSAALWPGSLQEEEPAGTFSYTEALRPAAEVGVDWIMQDESASAMALALQDSRTPGSQPLSKRTSAPVTDRCSSRLELLDQAIVTVSIPDHPDIGLAAFNERDQLSFGTPNEHQAAITGKVGEFVAFNYFRTKLSEGADVNWVNQDSETGLPYDIVIERNGESDEYIEVKSTKSAKKDWFEISSREWQFAHEKGDCFSIAHVVLMDDKNAKVTVFRNPVRLCQQGVLQLAVMMSRYPKDLSCTS